jgi:hypothetical protein
MSDTKHTKGPWKWQGTKNKPDAVCYLDSPNGKNIIALFDGCVRKADAQLIASAPALLEALEAYQKWEDAVSNARPDDSNEAINVRMNLLIDAKEKKNAALSTARA